MARVNADQLEREVWEKIVRWLNNQDEIATAAEKMAEGKTSSFEELEIDRLEAEIKRAKEGRKRLLNLFAQGLSISEEEIRESIRELKEKEEELRKRLEEVKTIIKELEQSRYTEELIWKAADYYLNKKGELTFEDKQEIIRHVVREVVVYEDRIEIVTF